MKKYYLQNNHDDYQRRLHELILLRQNECQLNLCVCFRLLSNTRKKTTARTKKCESNSQIPCTSQCDELKLDIRFFT